ncbi:hypothetical protein F1880_002595 [Penicillium rolfsii]|nr:hypothetical protein F1880_002595 [Penicillium rolfsii]
MPFPRNFRLFRTTMSGEKIFEGCFAVHKPQGITSADVLRDLQRHFNPSKLFKPWIEAEKEFRKKESSYQKNRRRNKNKKVEVKIGHGGTLDPLATGVLIAGVGKGTKSLNSFLACTKSYETVVLFGAETDTYDRLGKIVRRAPYEHITREAVEKALDQFRGKIMQRPPIFSALRIEGKRLYEYAREGKMPPVEIKSRPVETVELKIVEWYEPGTHEYKWPEGEMTGDEKIIAEKLLDKEAELSVESEAADPEASSAKRKTPPAADSPKEEEAEAAKRQKLSEDGTAQAAAPEPVASEPATAEAPSEQTDQDRPRPQPPAVKIHMTVTSGFYVRSLAHDLGKAVGSCGLMSELVRSRQAEFDLQPENVLEYKDLEQGEEVWGPKVQKFLENWEKKRAAEAEAENAKAQQ